MPPQQAIADPGSWEVTLATDSGYGFLPLFGRSDSRANACSVMVEPFQGILRVIAQVTQRGVEASFGA